MPEAKFRIFTVPFLVEPDALGDTTSEFFALNTKGWLTALDIRPKHETATIADMFVRVFVHYTGQHTIKWVTEGYCSANFGLQWEGRLPLDNRTDLAIEWVQQSGANRIIEHTVVIELE